MRAANNESRLHRVVLPHHSSRLSHHLRTHTYILQLYIRCDEIVLELRHGDFPAYLLIACVGRIFVALLKPTRTGTHIQCLILSALSKFSVSTTISTNTCLPRCKDAWTLNTQKKESAQTLSVNCIKCRKKEKSPPPTQSALDVWPNFVVLSLLIFDLHVVIWLLWWWRPYTTYRHRSPQRKRAWILYELART